MRLGLFGLDIKIDLRVVKVNKLKKNIVLAEDVYNEAAVLVAPKGTLLNDKIIDMIQSYGIDIVTVTEKKSKRAKKAEAEPEIKSIPEDRMESFTGFKNEYERMEGELFETLSAMREGKQLDINRSFEMTENIITKMRCKSDVFFYKHFMEGFDDHTASHSNNVAMLANIFGRWLRLNDDDVMTMTIAGMLHDIGKIEIPKEIITKTSALTPDEVTQIRRHSEKGYFLLKKHDLPKGAVMSALSHHERIDGSGYPQGLKGDKINFYARCIAIIDVYDAMTSPRSHHGLICPFEVIRHIETNMYNLLDTELMLIFLKNIAENYLGAWVTLSDGDSAEVVFIHPADISHPLVRKADGDFIDLSKKRDVKIVKIQ
jgi:putative nucleotidyltransferase with HDIG domain